MKKNMGTLDKTIRIVLALLIGTLYFTGVIGGTLSIVLLIFAVIFLVTSFISFCLLYYPFKISTKRIEEEHDL